jgi:hypothetical protein
MEKGIKKRLFEKRRGKCWGLLTFVAAVNGVRIQF